MFLARFRVRILFKFPFKFYLNFIFNFLLKFPLRFRLIFLLLLVLLPELRQAWCKTADITLVSASGDDGSSPTDLFAGGQWRPGSSRVAKLEMRLLEPQEFSRLELSTCDQALSDGVDLYVNFDEHYQFLESGKSKLVIALAESDKQKGRAVRTLAFNFRNNSDLCLTAPKFFNGADEISVQAPKNLPIESSVPLALFDARLETAAKIGGEPIEIKFVNEVIFGGLHIWNGNQTSELKFNGDPRARSLELEGDNGFKETVELSDRFGSQLVQFKKEFRGRSLRLLVRENYGGAPLGLAALSELQFVGGHVAGSAQRRDFFGLDIRAAQRALLEERKASFRSADLVPVLDRSLWALEGDDRWVLRFRSDGTFFLRGHSDNLKEAKEFSFLGFYTVIESSQRGLKLKINGGRFSSHLELDGSWCGRDCAGGSGVPAVNLEDKIIVTSTKKGSFFVRGSGTKRSTLLGHKSLKMIVSSGDD